MNSNKPGRVARLRGSVDLLVQAQQEMKTFGINLVGNKEVVKDNHLKIYLRNLKNSFLDQEARSEVVVINLNNKAKEKI
jgi:hypothetical protein